MVSCCQILLNKLQGPGSYNIKSSIGPSAPFSRAKRAHERPFISDRGRVYSYPLLDEHNRSDTLYDINTSSMASKVKGATMKGGRGRRFDSAKESNAVFLVPSLIDKTPGPGDYTIKGSFGDLRNVHAKGQRGLNRRQQLFVNSKAPGVSFKGDNFRASFLAPAMSNENPAPGSYDIKTTIGSRLNGLKESRAGKFGGPFHSNKGPLNANSQVSLSKRQSNAEYKVDSSNFEASSSFSFKGRRLKSLFGGIIDFPGVFSVEILLCFNVLFEYMSYISICVMRCYNYLFGCIVLHPTV